MSDTKTSSSAPCPHCKGSGRSEDMVAVTDEDGNMAFQLAPCPHCHGKGTLAAAEEVHPSPWVPKVDAEG